MKMLHLVGNDVGQHLCLQHGLFPALAAAEKALLGA